MVECINSLGFIFKSVKTFIKCDKKKKYSKHKCQECISKLKNNYKSTSYTSCGSCDTEDKYKICIFKLTKQNFTTSTLEISTSIDESWNNFNNSVLNLINGNFVISVTKHDKLHSFYANLIRVKNCKCCNVVYLYFKFNIIKGLGCYNDFNNNCTGTGIGTSINLATDTNLHIPTTFPNNYCPDNYPNNCSLIKKYNPCVNLLANIVYDLDSDTYYNVKFYYNNLYTNKICFKLCN